MPTLDAESIDAIVTDPPYGLEFMGKEWDRLSAPGRDDLRHRRRMTAASEPVVGNPWASERPSYGHVKKNPRCKTCGHQRFSSTPCACDKPEWDTRMAESGRAMQDWHHQWAVEALRVAKPGAHLLAFGGTRTYHRLACAIEDAGWEVRDCLVWAYASGFPKSLNLTGEWQGWGTALKPAWEPIILARKPLRGTVAANVAEYGTGALNIDGCRIGTTVETWPATRSYAAGSMPLSGHVASETQRTGDPPLGRWPANLLLTDPIFDGGVEGVVGGGDSKSGIAVQRNGGGGRIFDRPGSLPPVDGGYTDSGTYSRFFQLQEGDGCYLCGRASTTTTTGDRWTCATCADLITSDSTSVYHAPGDTRFLLIPKASRSDREPRAGGLEEREVPNYQPTVTVCECGERWKPPENGGLLRCNHPRSMYHYEAAPRSPGKRANHHPTVKPVALMRHLVRLVTPPGGIVLDPFLGSGTTALACEMEGFRWVGIEKEPEYAAIVEARLALVQRGLGL